MANAAASSSQVVAADRFEAMPPCEMLPLLAPRECSSEVASCRASAVETVGKSAKRLSLEPVSSEVVAAVAAAVVAAFQPEALLELESAYLAASLRPDAPYLLAEVAANWATQHFQAPAIVEVAESVFVQLGLEPAGLAVKPLRQQWISKAISLQIVASVVVNDNLWLQAPSPSSFCATDR